MPSNPRSLQLTDSYRHRLLSIANRAEQSARSAWPQITELDRTDWPERTAALLTRAQTEGLRLTSGYLTAYLRSETGRGTAPVIDSRAYVGLSRDGRPLSEALQSPLIGVKAALKAGKTPSGSLAIGWVRAARMVGFEAMQTPRDALTDTVGADERFTGVRRSVAGTCAACMALSGTDNVITHPNCQCLPMPTVRGVVEKVALPTGAALFAALSKSEQDKTIGPEAAELVRGGAPLKDFVAHSPTDSDQPNWITQKPAEDVTATT